jgi:hypothetical protein
VDDGSPVVVRSFLDEPVDLLQDISKKVVTKRSEAALKITISPGICMKFSSAVAGRG